MIVLAVDVVVQRAMYELSDKVAKAGRSSEVQSSARDIDRCVSIMSTLVVPLCESILRSFALTDIPGFSVSRFTEKVQTLSRQLQELTAWSSFYGQQKVRQSFPFLPITSGSRSNAGGGGAGAYISSPESARKTFSQLNTPEPSPRAPPSSAGRQYSVDVMDDNLKLFLKDMTPPGYHMSDVEKMRVKLHKLISRHVSSEVRSLTCHNALSYDLSCRRRSACAAPLRWGCRTRS